MNFRLMPQNNGESDLIWLFLTLETPTREKLMQGYRHDIHPMNGCTEGYTGVTKPIYTSRH